MKNKELIELLQKLPADYEVCICDVVKNSVEADEEGGTAGIYPEFSIALMEGDDVMEGSQSFIILGFMNIPESDERSCRICGCTDYDCSQCIEKTGHPCHWVDEDLCSACVDVAQPSTILLPGKDF